MYMENRAQRSLESYNPTPILQYECYANEIGQLSHKSETK